MIVHLGPAVGTEHQTREGVGNAGGIRPANRPLHLLGQLPCLRVNNGLVGVLKDQPIFRGVLHPLVPVGLFGGTEVHRMPHIFRPLQQGADGVAVPVIGAVLVQHGCAALFALLFLLRPLLGEIVAGTLHLLGGEHFGNLIGSVPLHGQPENAPHHGGGFLIHQPVVFVLRVFLVAVDGAVGCGLARLALHPVGRRNLFGLVAQIPLVHDIQKRRKFAAFLFVAVNIVGNSNKMNPVLPEHDLGIKAGLQVITTDPTEVFAQQVGHLPGLNVGDQAFPARTLKIAARPSIIRIVDNIGVAPLLCIAFEIPFLVQNGVRVARNVIVTGQALIERSYFFFRLSGCHIRRSFQTDGSFVAIPLYHIPCPLPAHHCGSTAKFYLPSSRLRFR